MGKAILVTAGCAAAFFGGMCLGIWVATKEIVDNISDDEVNRLIGDEIVGTVVKAASELKRHV